jgi:DivIVA domain-containing protein
MADVLTLLVVVGVAGILFGSAALAVYEGDVLRDASPDDRDTSLPDAAVQPEDVTELRFDMVLRGYRMSEVDDVLSRLAAELAARDSQIAQLEQALVAVVEPAVEQEERRQAGGFARPDTAPTPEPEPAVPAAPDWPSAADGWPSTPESAWSTSESPSLTATADDAFGFPEIPLPEQADADLPDAAPQESRAASGPPRALPAPFASASGLVVPDDVLTEVEGADAEPVAGLDQQQHSADTVALPIAGGGELLDVQESGSEEAAGQAEPALGTPGEGSASTGEAPASP